MDEIREIRVLVLGDEGVGKSSLISTYVSQIFSPVPPKMIPILVPPSHALPSVRATILDSSTADPIDLNGIDSVVLVYDLHRQSTFESLERVYLPIIAERNIPTILCASKVDKGTNPPPALLSLLSKYKFVHCCISVSSKTLLQINELFLTSMAIILYPLPPLFDLTTSELKPLAVKAFLRIYRMYTSLKTLPDSSLNTFQTHYFSAPLLSDDILGLKKIVSKSSPSSLSNGDFTKEGFLNIFKMFIMRNQLEMPWTVLKAEGYAVTEELTLDCPDFKWKGRMPASAERFLEGMKDGCGDGKEVDIQRVVEVIEGGVPWEEGFFFEGCWSGVGGELGRSGEEERMAGSIIVPPGSPRRTPTQPQQQQYDSRLDDSTALLDGGSILLEGEEGSEGEERMMPADEFVDAYILSYDVAPVKTLRHIHALGWRGIKEGEKESKYIRIRVLTGDSSTGDKILSVVSRYRKNRVVVTTVPWGSQDKGNDDDFDLTVFVIVEGRDAVIEEALECCRNLGREKRRCFVRLEDGSVDLGESNAAGRCEAVVKHCQERDLETPFISEEEGDAVAWLVECATSEGGESDKRVKPFEKEKRQALKRRKMFKYGAGFVGVLVLGVAGLTVWKKNARVKSLLEGITDAIGISNKSASARTGATTTTSASIIKNES
ncbi:hypothetical protein TrVE_jg5508 [Triparma verrucosa]|uniref:EF hand associated type-2 domain-containing protein n=1 Tax=Triparma verrucosa TaxID=1606542 RepID=A0A9W7FMF1_9STRA|nr:hypothetical protein TrVE_jg5508 [Triparma verrucosa]